ncbi:MAG: alpha/beta fold hydrolase [Gemmatimonadota bacterium]|nr:alpha/beta fold hydrolase [Gemmatimonadota bacterium]
MLLLHGFGDTPQTLSYLACGLNAAGYGVHAPLYPGHGTSVAEFFSSTANEWIASARSALDRMQAGCESVSIVGLSMGAAIGAILAAESANIDCLVLIAPYLRIPFWARIALRARWIWDPFVGEIEARSPRSVQDRSERDKSLGYGVVNGATMAELARVVRKARSSLPTVTAPTLVIQSREDPRVAPKMASKALERIGAKEKRLVWTKTGGHVLTVDFGRDDVIADTIDWIKRWGG